MGFAKSVWCPDCDDYSTLPDDTLVISGTPFPAKFQAARQYSLNAMSEDEACYAQPAAPARSRQRTPADEPCHRQSFR